MLTLLVLVVLGTLSEPLSAQQLKGSVAAVYDLIDRIIPGASAHFSLTILPEFSERPYFVLADSPSGVVVNGSSASEVSAGVGYYLREICNMTIGWPRGGGSNIFMPKNWPKVGTLIMKRRIAPWSYFMNVCTHSYSFVWYSWDDWSNLIDWMALNGINLVLAMTGQEEIQYRIFTQLGLSDEDIRTWFNGPAFLTWSRGQNEYGNNISGPLPRSWMKSQWNLQKQILDRYRNLGIVGQLPGFQGNVPWKLADILKDSNITRQGDTGWMDSLDPNFGKIADIWMQNIISDFGTDHWYQLDGYFNGGTAPWLYRPKLENSVNLRKEKSRENSRNLNVEPETAIPPCQWALATNSYLEGCSQNCLEFQTIDEAKSECLKYLDCGGITIPKGGKPQLRLGVTPIHSPTNETSYYITNDIECHVITPDPAWKLRGAAAYAGLSRTDPDAIWSFQGFAVVHWTTAAQASYFRGFVSAVPPGKFVVIDMSYSGDGEWRMWNNMSFYGAPFIWTTLHDFGGTDGMKGNLTHMNRIPFDAITSNNSTICIGSGYTPEGINQNPVVYEFLSDANFREFPVDDITSQLIVRAHKRYNLTQPNDHVTTAWKYLASSTYSQDLSVQDGTGVVHLPGTDTSQFLTDRSTPTQKLCATFFAWESLILAASAVSPNLEPFRYDLVNVGREILAQISTPMSHNFSDAIHRNPLNSDEITITGNKYIELLLDLDDLVSTDFAFLVGPWLESAKLIAENSTNDCGTKSCAEFYEWNARVQITTWKPVPSRDSPQIPPGPIDYASKHWSGLIRDYYAARAQLFMNQALYDSQHQKKLDEQAIARLWATLSYDWQNDTTKYPTIPKENVVEISNQMYSKYATIFRSCKEKLH